MPSSKQQPLTARRGTHEHDFTQSYADWEAAVFDRATHFAVVETRNKRKYSTWRYLPWAVKYCRQLDTGHWDIAGWCIYAVTATGRFTLLDHEKIDEWVQRWWENRDDKRTEAEPGRSAATMGGRDALISANSGSP
jgi:hypothetical protein